MKIIYIGNKLSKKGATQTSIETLGKFLQEEEYEVVTASSVKNKPLRLLHMLWTVIIHAPSSQWVLIDTYSTQNYYFALAVASLCRKLKIRYIPILRGGNLPQRIQKSRNSAQKLFTHAYMNVAPSQYLMNAFQKEGFRNLVHIPNTIKIENYSFKQRAEIGPRLLWVRSFSSLYQPFLAIQIVESLIQTYSDTKLTMVGPAKDETFERCRSYVDAHKLPVKFTGMLSKEAWIELSKDHDIFINTTDFDNTPVSVIEAMALGLPVISTDVGGIPYLIDHEVDGILVPPRMIEPFVKEIESLLADPDMVVRLTRNARQKVEGYDWNHVKHLWNELLSGQ